MIRVREGAKDLNETNQRHPKCKCSCSPNDFFAFRNRSKEIFRWFLRILSRPCSCPFRKGTTANNNRIEFWGSPSVVLSASRCNSKRGKPACKENSLHTFPRRPSETFLCLVQWLGSLHLCTQGSTSHT